MKATTARSSRIQTEQNHAPRITLTRITQKHPFVLTTVECMVHRAETPGLVERKGKHESTSKSGGTLVQVNRSDDSPVAGNRCEPRPFPQKTILVPIDFSNCSRKALQYAISFAKQFNASIMLLHVVPPIYRGAIELTAEIEFSKVEREIREDEEKRLCALVVDDIKGQISADTLVRTGEAAQEIVSTARRLGTDLIVIAKHGYTSLKHVFLGSTVERVVCQAPCPVLLVPEQEPEFAKE